MPAEPSRQGLEPDPQGDSSGGNGDPKLSQILLELIRPFLAAQGNTLAEMKRGIHLAGAVWNATVLEQQGKDAWQRLLRSLREIPSEQAAKVVLMVEAMHQQILHRHASDLRTILSWTVTERGDAFNVRIESARAEVD